MEPGGGVVDEGGLGARIQVLPVLRPGRALVIILSVQNNVSYLGIRVDLEEVNEDKKDTG